MKELKRVHILDQQQYDEMIEELGSVAWFKEMRNGYHHKIQGLCSSKKPHDIYVLKESAEWLLSQ